MNFEHRSSPVACRMFTFYTFHNNLSHFNECLHMHCNISESCPDLFLDMVFTLNMKNLIIHISCVHGQDSFQVCFLPFAFWHTPCHFCAMLPQQLRIKSFCLLHVTQFSASSYSPVVKCLNHHYTIYHHVFVFLRSF